MADTQIYAALNPRASMNDIQQVPLAPRIKDLSCSVIYFVESWPVNSGFEEILLKATEHFKQRYPKITINQVKKPNAYSMDDPEFWDELIQKADAFVYFSGPSCSTTSYAITWPAKLEKRGLPGVTVLYEYLIEDAEVAKKREGVKVRYAPVPYPYDKIPNSQMSAILQQIEEALTRPLTPDECVTGLYKQEKPPRICMEGTISELQDYYYNMGWTDGLPIIPPTEENVAEMLRGTSHSPDEVVTTRMAPEEWKVTVENVAINAVMAGAKPNYMPLLLAVVELLGGKNPSFDATTKSTNSFSYMQVVNGPIRNELEMNSGTYALGPGNKANAVIGRAMRLFLINLGGSKVGVNLMGVQGNVSSYTFAFAENEENSPWESLAEEKGFDKNESTITIFTGGWCHVGTYFSGDIEQLAEATSFFELTSGIVVLLAPRQANNLAEKGYTKESIKEYIWENAAMSLGRFNKNFYRKRLPEEYLGLPDTAMIPVYPRNQVHVIVVGDHRGTPMMQGWQMSGPAIASIDKWR